MAREIFDEHMKAKNQIRMPAEKQSPITEKDLLQIPEGCITEAGVRRNIDVALQYIESWLRGNGCVPIYNLMEDAATAEISRAQLWQWIHHGARMDDGRTVTIEICENLLGEVLWPPTLTFPRTDVFQVCRRVCQHTARSNDFKFAGPKARESPLPITENKCHPERSIRISARRVWRAELIQPQVEGPAVGISAA